MAMISAHKSLCTPLLRQMQSVCCAQLLVEFCRRHGAWRYPVARGVHCGSAGVRAGAAVGARPSENRNCLSLRAIVWTARDATALSALTVVRGDGCHHRTRSVQRVFLSVRGYGPRKVGTASKTVETCWIEEFKKELRRRMRQPIPDQGRWLAASARSTRPRTSSAQVSRLRLAAPRGELSQSDIADGKCPT